jgi:hypothetical protein
MAATATTGRGGHGEEERDKGTTKKKNAMKK